MSVLAVTIAQRLQPANLPSTSLPNLNTPSLPVAGGPVRGLSRQSLHVHARLLVWRDDDAQDWAGAMPLCPRAASTRFLATGVPEILLIRLVKLLHQYRRNVSVLGNDRKQIRRWCTRFDLDSEAFRE